MRSFGSKKQTFAILLALGAILFGFFNLSKIRAELTYVCRVCGAKSGRIEYRISRMTYWTVHRPITEPVSTFVRLLGKPHEHEWAGGPAYIFYADGNHGDGQTIVPEFSEDQTRFTYWSFSCLDALPASSEQVAWEFHLFVINAERNGCAEILLSTWWERRPRTIDEYLEMLRGTNQR